MGINKDARRAAANCLESLVTFETDQLVTLALLLGISPDTRITGGKVRTKDKSSLIHEIRSQVNRGTFADRLWRFTEQCREYQKP